jgi:hypothetical protein
MLAESTSFLTSVFQITTPEVSSSSSEAKGQKGELILTICKELGATTYLSGPFGRDYLDPRAFNNLGISVEFDDYVHPIYTQQGGEFVPFLSAIYILFNHGASSAGFINIK